MQGIKECTSYMIDNALKKITHKDVNHVETWFDGKSFMITDLIAELTCEIKNFKVFDTETEWSIVKEPVHFFDWEEDVYYLNDHKSRYMKSNKVIYLCNNGKQLISKGEITYFTDMKWYKEEAEYKNILKMTHRTLEENKAYQEGANAMIGIVTDKVNRDLKECTNPKELLENLVDYIDSLRNDKL